MSSSSAAREPRFEFASSGRHLVATGVVRHVEPRSWVGTGVARAVEEVLAAPLEAPQLVVGVLPFLAASFIALILCIIFPPIVTFLPSLLSA